MVRKIQRRRFLQSTAAASAGFYLTAGCEGPLQAAQQAANNRLNVAFVAAGGKAESNIGGFSGENIVALCDVDQRRAANSFKRYPKAAVYSDYRVMLDKQKDIDVVVVSTPDHVHAHASIAAMRMGKHVYCEKPLTHSVYEARLMREVAAKHKVATQMGNQGTSHDGLRAGVEVIRAGTIGDVNEVHVWTNRPIWAQNITRPKPGEVPQGLDWDLWLGPAPQRTYHGGVVPFSWRGYWDFGTGALGDMACHTMNLCFMALGLGAPTSVQADLDPKGSTNIAETAPMGVTVTYEFPAREVAGRKMPPVRLFWYERRYPPEKLLQGQKRSDSGSIMIGSKGSMYSPSDYGSSWVLLPRETFANFKNPNPTLPRAKGHYQEFIQACKGGPPAMSNFNYAGPFTETVLLGNVAMRVGGGKRVVWDSEKLQCVGMPEANRFIRREYRKGWSLEG